MNDAPSATRPSKLMRGATGDWEVVVGMEVHAQVTSKAKLFSGAATSFGAEPNSQVSLVDAAMPGMLPVINRQCVAQAVRTGLGLQAKINLVSRFDRKNYFYPDLPQGYQISQYQQPIVGEGTVTVDLPDGGTFQVGIERLHIEQDAGKSLHDQHATHSYVDLNRAGVALMEIVSRPDIRSADEAKAFLTKLRSILRYLGTSDADMEKGNLRADVNVSVRRPGEPLGTRCEIKNVNSIRFVGQAIEHEARRQIQVIEDGGTIEQQTRLYDSAKRETRPMRSKEEAHDYRYFPDPDLLPLVLDPEWVESLRAALPELPDAKRARLMSEYGLTPERAANLAADPAVADFYEAVCAELAFPLSDPDLNLSLRVYHWVTGELFSALNYNGVEIRQSKLTPRQLASVVQLERDQTYGRKAADAAFMEAWDKGGDPLEIAERLGLRQITDTGAIAKVVDDILAANPDKVAQARQKPAVLGWFVGQVMKASQGKANPQAVNALLKAKLGL